MTNTKTLPNGFNVGDLVEYGEPGNIRVGRVVEAPKTALLRRPSDVWACWEDEVGGAPSIEPLWVAGCRVRPRKQTQPQPGSVAVTTQQHSVIFTPEVLSDFDTSRGDQRKFDRDEAFRLAVQRTYERECPQAIYRGGPALDGGQGMWVVRDAQVRS